MQLLDLQQRREEQELAQMQEDLRPDSRVLVLHLRLASTTDQVDQALNLLLHNPVSFNLDS
jgi:hypothetical protein